MQFVDLSAQQRVIRSELEAAIRRVLDHGAYILGREVGELELALARLVGTGHCVTCGNGTDALQIALMALGVGPGNEVVVPTFTFVATAEAVALLGAVPVFVDVLPDTYLIDPAAVAAALTPRTRAVVPVSIFGQCPDFEAISGLGRRAGIAVVEDAAQSLGARHHGRPSCSIADVSCTSFFPSKPLGCYGDGGAVFTARDDLAERIRKIARHGQSRRYEHDLVGMNSRLDTLQAAILLAKLPVFERELELRRAAAACYGELLAEHGLAAPVVAAGNESVFAQYTIEVDDRAEVRGRLDQAGIPTAVHYPRPLHRQPAFADRPAVAPVAERATERVLSLPMHPYLEASDCRRVVAAVARAVAPAR